MDGWITALISAACTTAITTVVGLIIKRYFSKYISLREQKLDELQQLREDKIRRERKADTEEVVNRICGQLQAKVDEIDSKMTKVEDGAKASLRNDILECYYRCVDKGYRNEYDTENCQHMFDTYKELKGNSYVADIMNRFMELPTKEQFKKKVTAAKKAKAE